MKVFVKGKGEVNLTQQNYVATGGQASVYIKSGTAYKIYTDPKDMIPMAKFGYLSSIKDDHVIHPDGVLLDASNTPIGYTMAAVQNPVALCQLFTKPFCDRNSITRDNLLTVAAKLREHVQNVHKAGVLIVDLNELNILVPNTFDDTYLIDVDSYQTKGYPATVIMPSVRDFSVPSKDFSPLSDWYSYGILAFQLFIGSHPYRGTHPGSANVPKDQKLEYRMKNNISAFRPDVVLPKCCYPLDSIPKDFKDWLKAVLEEGKRLAPPDPRGGPAVVVTALPATAIQFLTGLSITEVKDLEGFRLTGYSESNGQALYLTDKTPTGFFMSAPEIRVYLGAREIYRPSHLPGTTLVGFTPKLSHPVGLNLYRGQLTFLDFERKTQEVLPLKAHEIAKSGDRFYIRNGTQVLEVEFAETSGKITLIASHAVANVLEMSSKLYEGCVLQNMMGSYYASLFPRSKAGYQVRLKELDSYRIQDAKFDGGVLMVIGSKNGKYDRMVFRFDEDYQTYDLRTIEDITVSGLNFITLSSGVCVVLTEEEKIEAFSVKKGSAGVKVVDDPAIGNDMRLLKVNGKAGFERAGKIYQMSLK